MSQTSYIQAIYKKTFLNKPYVIYSDCLSRPQICNLLSEIQTSALFEARVMEAEGSVVDHSMRKSKIALLPPKGEIHEIIWNLSLKANREHWNFAETLRCENIQYAEYGIGDHFQWHHDMYDNERNVRLISAIILLDEPSVDFEGGNFEIKSMDGKVLPVSLKKGDMVVFPACSYHRVNIVEAGMRRTLGLSIFTSDHSP